MKKQILMIAVAMSTLTIAANAQEKKAEPKAKKETTTTNKDAKAATATKKDAKASTTKQPKAATPAKANK
jgi:hypothetical protein